MKKRTEIRDYISFPHVSGNDRFVGLRSTISGPEIVFPIGYVVPESDSQLRGDARQLLELISIFDHAQVHGEESDGSLVVSSRDSLAFRAYKFLIEDFLRTRALLNETELTHSNSPEGQIDWNRTIALRQPAIVKGSVLYLDLISRKPTNLSNSVIRAAHNLALFRSFSAIGWLYPETNVPRPRAILVDSEMLNAVKRRMQETFNDRQFQILSAILKVLSYSSSDETFEIQTHGTDKFEVMWEYLVDQFFGSVVSGKEEYFPRSRWNLNRRSIKASPLRPDTIMLHDNSIFVLDAKYYRYGATLDSRHLPGTADVSKQIIYCEHVVSKQPISSPKSVYNAFLLPGNLKGDDDKWCEFVGTSSVSWITNPKSHQTIAAVLIDTNFLLRNFRRPSYARKRELASLISDHFGKCG